MVGARREIEGQLDVYRFAVEGTEIEMIGDQLQNALVLNVGRFETGRVDVAGTNAPRLQRDPAVTSLLAVFFQNEFAALAAIEIGHLRKGLLHAVKKMQYRLPARGKLHFAVQVNVDSKVI